MKIDNSRASLFRKCPYAYWERYVNNLARIPTDSSPLELGTRVHQLLEEHYCQLKGAPIVPFPPSELQAIEDEAQYIVASYIGHYPMEPFTPVDCEKYFEVEIPGTGHTLIGEIDMVVRKNDTQRLAIFETKTEKRGSNNNSEKAWAMRPQVGLYKWAASQVYGEEVEGIILNVISRASEKGQMAPTFRRDDLDRSPVQIAEALSDIVYWADQIERCSKEVPPGQPWPANRDRCVEGFMECSFYPLHLQNRGEELLRLYQPAKEYLEF